MKIENVYIKPDGEICACIVPVPEEPKEWLDDEGYMASLASPLYARKMKEYRQALKACKESAVRFEDQMQAFKLMHPYKPNPDTFYPLQCSIQIVDYHCPSCGYSHEDQAIHNDHHLCKTPLPEYKKVARLIPEAKGHGFCEKSGHVCTMNYCDENGCQERKRVLVEPAPIVEESQLIIVTRKLQKNLEDYKRMRDGWKEGTHQYEAYALMVREYRKIIDMLLPIAITRKP